MKPTFDSSVLAENIVALGQKLARTAYPNPDRVGCPDQTALLDFANKLGARSPEQSRLISHIASCSPCYRELTAERERLRRKRRWLTAVAASLAASFALAFWLWPRSMPPAQRPSMTASSSKPAPEVNRASLTVDLAKHSPTRSADQEIQPIILPSLALDLSLLLPVGAEPGSYRVEVRQGSRNLFVSTETVATLRGGAVVIGLPIDLRSANPGRAVLIVQAVESSPREYLIEIRDVQ